MLGLMQNHPLRIIDILTFAAEVYQEQGLTSVNEDRCIQSLRYPEVLKRVSQLAHALTKLGLGKGDRIATLAWNTHRHYELYYAISGIGAVCHTINPRLPEDQMLYIFEHAQDRVIFVDKSLLHLIEKLQDRLPSVEHVVVLADGSNMSGTEAGWLSYEDLLAAESDSFDWPVFPEETAAGLCYTSGTTGDPKGALYSHRSTVLHALFAVAGYPQSLKLGKAVLPVVPLFHVNAWGLPYAATLAGADMVLPGPHLDGPSLYDLMNAQNVFTAWGVPTVWAGLLQEIEKRGKAPDGFADLVVGGAAAPRSMIAAFEAMGINVNQVWGMTEMSPIGTSGLLPTSLDNATQDQRVDAKVGAGRRLFGTDFKLLDENRARVPHDGESQGELFVRGNTIISEYFENEAATEAAMDNEGWFGTGDVATLDARGKLIVRDRSKDLVKSGGEWISSIDLENAAVAHPDLRACAVIAVPHPKWDERPVLVAVAEGQVKPSLDEVNAHLSASFARWQLPDDIIYVDVLPLTATGKVSKITLRKQMVDYVLPEFRDVSA
ncbi:MAG: long-chain fatty acid--CoA ligase [Pseudomonadota bacterium]